MTGRPQCYLPIDELLSDWVFLILRAVRRFDWVESSDIAIALDVPPADVDRQRRNKFDVTLSRCARRGYLERVGRPCSFRYQITEAGRREYERQLGRNAA